MQKRKEVGRKTDAYKAHIEDILNDSTRAFFRQDILEETRAFGAEVRETDMKNRRDFRNIATITIDPIDAKDFDDALSVSFLPNGSVEVGVHIADVSHYVKERTHLDREALKRGTSIYLVNRVIPMLPEALSNELCSLKPDVDRLTLSVLFTIDTHGAIRDTWFGEAIIHSKKRFSYEAAQHVLTTGDGPFKKELTFLDSYAKRLLKERIANGSIILEEDEIKFELDSSGTPIKAHRKQRLETHSLIEEWMLLANRTVAELFRDAKKTGVFCYRVHGKPDKEKLAFFIDTAKHAGYKINSRPSTRALHAFIEHLKGKPSYDEFNKLLMRAMAKAVYSTKNSGHYALAFKHYTHFTSPIRRYPDIISHRMLKKYLAGDKVHLKETKKYESELVHLSEREREASDAERASVKRMQVLYMANRVGNIYKGYVTGVIEHGIFVAEAESKAEGMIHLSNLDGSYLYHEGRQEMRSKKLNRTLKLGTPVTIRVDRVNLERKLIDYALIT